MVAKHKHKSKYESTEKEKKKKDGRERWLRKERMS